MGSIDIGRAPGMFRNATWGLSGVLLRLLGSSVRESLLNGEVSSCVEESPPLLSVGEEWSVEFIASMGCGRSEIIKKKTLLSNNHTFAEKNVDIKQTFAL